jgi:GTP-binding protein HflX
VPENVITVGLILPELTRSVTDEHLEELGKLVETAGGAVVATIVAKRPAPDPATYIGSGKAEEVRRTAERHDVALIVFDDDLSPAQVRNLEKITGKKVIDRSALILDIFAGRARSREARTQVELAQLEYMLPRLTRQWSHLERQAGGIGTRGVGETQLELDRRIVRTRISRLKDELSRIEKHRQTQRKGRKSAFTVALVGYTNAGKSTLFNRLAGGNAVAVDKLFATLDAKSSRTAFEMPRETVVIDTVGFIRKLPHHLVASFRSTMEEAVAADLVLHLIDQSHPQFEDQREVGEQVLAELGVDPARVLEVYNKADRLEDALEARRRNGVSISALTGRGVETLVNAIREREVAGGEVMQLDIPHDESRLSAKLHELGAVFEQRPNGESTRYTAWVPPQHAHLFERYAVRLNEKVG